MHLHKRTRRWRERVREEGLHKIRSTETESSSCAWGVVRSVECDRRNVGPAEVVEVANERDDGVVGVWEGEEDGIAARLIAIGACGWDLSVVVEVIVVFLSGS